MVSSQQQQQQQVPPATTRNYPSRKKWIFYSSSNYNLFSNVCGCIGNGGSSTSSNVITYLFARHVYENLI